MNSRARVFAAIRVDEFSGFDSAEPATIANYVTIKEVLPTLEEAEREGKRLNALNGNQGAYYFWQATRYFPEGRSMRAAP